MKSFIGDKNFRVDCQDMAVSASHPGYRFIVEITVRERIRNENETLYFKEEAMM